MADMTESQRRAFEASLQRAQAAAATRAEVPTQRVRTAAQGLTFGVADEIEARAISLTTGRPYREVLDEVRGKIKAYQEARPTEALGAEIAGAVLPGLFTGGAGLAATGARLLPRVGRAAAVGAAEGGLYAFGTGEGGFGERMARVPGGAIAGGIAAPIAGEAAALAMRPAQAVIDIARRRLGGRGAASVERELQRLQQESGKTVDEIVADIADGRIMAENATLRDAVRAYRAAGGESATMLREALTMRPQKTREEAIAEIQRYLSDVQDENVLRGVRRSEEQARVAERAAYGQFETQMAPPDVVAELAEALRRVPGASGEVATALRARTGESPFFEVLEDGSFKFTRAPTLMEAERVRRAISNYATRLYRESQGGAGEEVAGVGERLRGAIDVSVPEMAATRTQAATVRTARDSFTQGQTIFGKSSDEVEVEFDKIAGMGDEALRSFRAGVMDALRRRMETGSRKSMMGKLSDPDTKEGRILRTIFPQDELPAVLAQIERAAESQAASTAILGGSPTAITLQQIQRQGVDLSMEDLSAVMSGDPAGIVRAGTKLVGGMTRGLTDAQRKRIVEVLVSEDPAFVERALRDESGMAMLQQAVNRLASGLTAGAQRGAVVPAAGLGATMTGGLLAQ